MGSGAQSRAPGTGKTTVITALVRYFTAERGARVLLTSIGHRAIDNALDRLGPDDAHVLRLGQSSKISGAGQRVLLQDVVAEAERTMVERQSSAQRELEQQLRTLEQVEQALVDLEAVDEAIATCEVRIAQRILDSPPAWSMAFDPRHHQRPGWVELRNLRQHLADLRARQYRLTVQAAAHPATGGAADVHRLRGRMLARLQAMHPWREAIAQPGAVADLVVETAEMIAATAIGINSGRDGARLADLEFDVAIVDEAGQAQLTDLIVPLSRARRVILVGDHQQLPPYVDDDVLRRCAEQNIDTTWLEQSVFEAVWNRVPASHRARLDRQFRMPSVIASFLSRTFYEGDLTSAPACEGGSPVCSLFRSPVVLVDTSAAADRWETPLSPGFTNPCEASLLAQIAAGLPEQYRQAEGLGVIAPYGAQVNLLRQRLAQRLSLGARDPWLLDNVATVDSFQGQERDVLLISLTRSNSEGSVGFLTDLKRLNVTLSRARKQLVILGDLSTLTRPGGRPERQKLARFCQDLTDHLRQHGEVVSLNDLRRRMTGE
jgi:hypothetical protein